MEKVIDYRRHAEECRALATRARSPDEKQMLMHMVESWEALAETRERALSRRESAALKSNT